MKTLAPVLIGLIIGIVIGWVLWHESCSECPVDCAKCPTPMDNCFPRNDPSTFVSLESAMNHLSFYDDSTFRAFNMSIDFFDKVGADIRSGHYPASAQGIRIAMGHDGTAHKGIIFPVGNDEKAIKTTDGKYLSISMSDLEGPCPDMCSFNF